MAGHYYVRMLLPEVLRLARSLLDQHGLEHWQVSLDRARRRAGQCDERNRRVTLSRHLMALYEPDEVRETVLHEIAHALVGSRHGHDAVWVAKAQAIGASGRRLVEPQAPRLTGRWVGRCPAGHEVDRMRRPSVPLSCARCCPRFHLEHLLSWSCGGRPVPPAEIGAGYARRLELARQTRP